MFGRLNLLLFFSHLEGRVHPTGRKSFEEHRQVGSVGQGGLMEGEHRGYRGQEGRREVYDRSGAMYGHDRETQFARIESRSTNESSNR